MKDAEKIAREWLATMKWWGKADIIVLDATSSNTINGQGFRYIAEELDPDEAEKIAATHNEAIRSAYSAGYAAAREQAAGVAHNFTGAQHAAHDMKTGVFPKQTYMGEAIADTIRAMEPPNE